MRILGWFALQVVGGPALPTSPLASAAAAAVAVLAGAGGGWDVSGDGEAAGLGGAGMDGWDAGAVGGSCAGPIGGWSAVEGCERVGAVMDMLDPVVSGVDGRMGLRQVPGEGERARDDDSEGERQG